MMRPTLSSISSLYIAALLLSTIILPTHGYVASSASMQQQQQRVAALPVPGRRTHHPHKSESQPPLQPHQAVALNADYSIWSPQRVPTVSPSKLPMQQLDRSSRKSSSSILQTPLNSVDDFKAFLDGAGEHELVLIKFHASWCRSCAKLGRKLDQLAHQYHAEQQQQQQEDGRDSRSSTTTPFSSPLVRIGTVEYMAGRDICRALNIEALPTIHLYTRDCSSNGGTMRKVQDFTCPPSAFDQVQAYCRYYVDQARLAQQKVPVPNMMAVKAENLLLGEQEQSFTEALDQGHAMMQASLRNTQKTGKLRSGWKRLFAVTGDRLRRVVNSNIEQEAAIALLD